MREHAVASIPTRSSSLPIFPLPNCVLLPGGLLPLHVFEPRYRELTRDCLAGHQLMAVARLRPGYETTYYGRPPVYERCGVGRIICSEELPGRPVRAAAARRRARRDRARAARRARRTAWSRRAARRCAVRSGRRARSPPQADHAVRSARRGDRARRPAAPRSRARVRRPRRVRRCDRRRADHGCRCAPGAARGVRSDGPPAAHARPRQPHAVRARAVR